MSAFGTLHMFAHVLADWWLLHWDDGGRPMRQHSSLKWRRLHWPWRLQGCKSQQCCTDHCHILSSLIPNYIFIKTLYFRIPNSNSNGSRSRSITCRTMMQCTILIWWYDILCKLTSQRGYWQEANCFGVVRHDLSLQAAQQEATPRAHEPNWSKCHYLPDLSLSIVHTCSNGSSFEILLNARNHGMMVMITICSLLLWCLVHWWSTVFSILRSSRDARDPFCSKPAAAWWSSSGNSKCGQIYGRYGTSAALHSIDHPQHPDTEVSNRCGRAFWRVASVVWLCCTDVHGRTTEPIIIPLF